MVFFQFPPGINRVQYVWSVLRDPLRRVHLIWRAIESLVGFLVCLGVWIRTENFGLAVSAGLMAEFVWYEFLIEPWSKRRVKRGKRSLAGPYWERGPQDGETFEVW